MKQNIKIRVSAFILVIILLLSLCSCRRVITLSEIPEYKRSPYVEINGGVPYFTEQEITTEAFESYSPLDTIGRCGVAFACIGIEIMPTENRGDIADVIPSGWEYNGVSNNHSYDFVEGGYVYNRCHLIGYQLTGENDNERNLITGTRYLNIEGMLPFENKVDDYIEETGNHVMYRVTPIYQGINYLAGGVLMEAYSVEDDGAGISFCIFAYNVQPGVIIDYYTGANVASGEELPDLPDDNREEIMNGATENDGSDEENGKNDEEESDGKEIGNTDAENADFVINTNSKKFHKADSSCVDKISEKNIAYYKGDREDLIAEEYSPCGICKP